MMKCPECGEWIEVSPKARTLSVVIDESLFQEELHFTDKFDEDKTSEDIDKEIEFFAKYKQMYQDNIIKCDEKVVDLDELKKTKEPK